MGDYTPDRDYSTTPLTDADNLNPGEGSNAAKAVDAELLGVDFVDHQKYTKAFTSCLVESIVTAVGEATLTTPTKVIDLEHKVQIVNLDDHRVWEGIANADDTIKIRNAVGAGFCHLISGTPVANYTGYVAATDFYVCTVGSTNYRRLVGKDGIAVGVAPGAFGADDLPRDNAPGASDVDTDLTALETALTAEHIFPGTGKHDAEFLVESYVNNECFVDDGYDERIRNGNFEEWYTAPKGAWAAYEPYPYYWYFSGNALTELEHDTTNTYKGNTYSCKIVSKGNGDQLYQSLENAASLASGIVSGYVYIKGDVDREFKIYLWGNVSGNPGSFTTHILTGGWDRFLFSRAMVGDAEIRLIIERVDVNDSTYYIGQVTAFKGRLQKGHGEAQSDSVICVMEDSTKQWLFNNNWDIWQETNEAPMGWEPIGTATVARNVATVFGKYSASITPVGNGDGIKQCIGDIDLALDYFKGKTVWAFAWLLQSAALATAWKLELDDGVTTAFAKFDINAGFGGWTLVAVPLAVDAAAAKLDWKLYRDDADLAHNKAVICSTCGLIVGDRPIFWKPRNSVWEARDYVFWCDGSCATGTILNHRQEIMETIYPIYLSAYANAAPGLKDMSFKLFTNNVDRAFSVNIAVGVSDGHEKQVTLDAVNTDIINPDDYIHIQALESVPGGTDPQDVRIALRAYTLSI